MLSEDDRNPDISLALNALRDFVAQDISTTSSYEDFSSLLPRIGDNLFTLLDRYGEHRPVFLNLEEHEEHEVSLFSIHSLTVPVGLGEVTLSGRKAGLVIRRKDYHYLAEVELPGNRKLDTVFMAEVYGVVRQDQTVRELYPLHEPQDPRVMQEYLLLLQSLVHDLISPYQTTE